MSLKWGDINTVKTVPEEAKEKVEQWLEGVDAEVLFGWFEDGALLVTCRYSRKDEYGTHNKILGLRCFEIGGQWQLSQDHDSVLG